MIAYLITRFIFTHGTRQKQYLHYSTPKKLYTWVFESSKATRFSKYDEAVDISLKYLGDLELAPME